MHRPGVAGNHQVQMGQRSRERTDWQSRDGYRRAMSELSNQILLTGSLENKDLPILGHGEAIDQVTEPLDRPPFDTSPAGVNTQPPASRIGARLDQRPTRGVTLGRADRQRKRSARDTGNESSKQVEKYLRLVA